MSRDLIEERKKIEQRMLNLVLNQPAGARVELSYGYNGRVLGYTPYMVNTLTYLYVKDETRYKYANLSNEIHNDQSTKRSEIEDKIREIVDFGNLKFLHLYLNEWIESYESIVEFCSSEGLPIISKSKYRALCNLIKKWKIESQSEHHQMTKRQRQKLKRREQQYLKRCLKDPSIYERDHIQ